jgi:hypothetical protein
MTFLGLSVFLAFQLSILNPSVPLNGPFNVPIQTKAEVRLSEGNVFVGASYQFDFASNDPIGLYRYVTDSNQPFFLRPLLISYSFEVGIKSDFFTLGYNHTISQSLCSSYSDQASFLSSGQLYIRFEEGSK